MKLPREQAINGVQAFQSMRDNFREYLASFAEEGKVISKEDVETFFEQQRSKTSE